VAAHVIPVCSDMEDRRVSSVAATREDSLQGMRTGEGPTQREWELMSPRSQPARQKAALGAVDVVDWDGVGDARHVPLRVSTS
jgi:hypothetical protein